MPEGDTLHKVAAYMQPRMVGTHVAAATAAQARLSLLQGRPILDVRAVGKHLLIDLGRSDASVAWHLRVHLGMHGTWHVYGLDEAWQRPAWQASVAVTTSAGQRFVCFNAQDVELLRPDEVLTTSPISRLGPDLLATDCDFEAIVRRARRRCNAAPMVDTLLDQTVAAGFGNVYKSELLFLFGLYPGRLTETVDDTLIKAIYARGRDLLQQNLGGWSRTTTFDPRPTAALRAGNGPRLYVYRRRAAPCLHCQAPISRALMGKHQRSTYWCPVCQPLTGQANVLSP